MSASFNLQRVNGKGVLGAQYYTASGPQQVAQTQPPTPPVYSGNNIKMKRRRGIHS